MYYWVPLPRSNRLFLEDLAALAKGAISVPPLSCALQLGILALTSIKDLSQRPYLWLCSAILWLSSSSQSNHCIYGQTQLTVVDAAILSLIYPASTIQAIHTAAPLPLPHAISQSPLLFPRHIFQTLSIREGSFSAGKGTCGRLYLTPKAPPPSVPGSSWCSWRHLFWPYCVLKCQVALNRVGRCLEGGILK